MVIWWLVKVVASFGCKRLSVVGLDRSMSQQQVFHFQQLTVDGIFMCIFLVAKKIQTVQAGAMSRERVCMEKFCILLCLCFAVATVQGDPTVLFDPTTFQQKDREHVEKVLVPVDSIFLGLWQWVRPSNLCLMISAQRCRK